MSRQSTYIDTESSLVVAWDWGNKEQKLTANGHKDFWRVLEML